MKLKPLQLLCVMALTACGGTTPFKTSEVKVIGGERVTKDELLARATVALVSEDGETFCSGTLVSAYHVVTAAHCVGLFPKDHPFYVGFGTEIREGQIKLSQMRSVKKTTLHEKFDREKLKERLEQDRKAIEEEALRRAEAKAPEAESTPKTAPFEMPSDEELADFGGQLTEAWDQNEPNYDVAVLLLSSPAPEGTVPAKVFPFNGPEIPQGLGLTVAGYGLTSTDPLYATPEATEAATSEPEPVTGVLNRLELLVLHYTKKSNEFVLIGEPGKGICSGDSGGPAFLAGKDPATGEEIQFLVGVAGASDCQMMAFYTDIRPFAKFVHQTVVDDLSELLKKLEE